MGDLVESFGANPSKTLTWVTSGLDRPCVGPHVRVEAECSSENILKYVFRATEFEQTREQLRVLLRNRPILNDIRGSWDWCIQVYSLVSKAYWCTNLRPGYLPGIKTDSLNLPGRPLRNDYLHQSVHGDIKVEFDYWADPGVSPIASALRPVPPVVATEIRKLSLRLDPRRKATSLGGDYTNTPTFTPSWFVPNAVIPDYELKRSGFAYKFYKGDFTPKIVIGESDWKANVPSFRQGDTNDPVFSLWAYLEEGFHYTDYGGSDRKGWRKFGQSFVPVFGFVAAGTQETTRNKERYWFTGRREQMNLAYAWGISVLQTEFGEYLQQGTVQWIDDVEQRLPESARPLTPDELTDLRRDATQAEFDELFALQSLGGLLGDVLGAVLSIFTGLFQLMVALGGVAVGGVACPQFIFMRDLQGSCLDTDVTQAGGATRVQENLVGGYEQLTRLLSPQRKPAATTSPTATKRPTTKAVDTQSRWWLLAGGALLGLGLIRKVFKVK